MDARVRGLMMKIFPLSLSLLATAKQIGSGSVVSDRPGDLLPVEVSVLPAAAPLGELTRDVGGGSFWRSQ